MQNNFFLKIKFSYPILFAVIINSAFADQDSIKAGEQKAMLCTACHGVEKSVNPEWPNLSQQSKKYLVEPGELPGLLPGFTTVSYNEDWFDDRHEARFVARRTLE